MSAPIPKTMKAVVEAEEGRTASVREVPLPVLEANDMLVKVDYAAQNLADWKHAAYYSPPNAIIGCDFSGAVVAIGSSPANTGLKVGDRIAGCVHGGQFKDKGSFTEFLRAESDLVYSVPPRIEGDLAEASAFGVPWVTACQAMIESQGKSWPPARVPDSPWYDVYGASSAVGIFAVQLGHLMGYRIIALCSPHDAELVKSLGADEVVDYHDAEKASADIKRISGGGVTLGLDTISEGKSFQICLGGFGDKGGRLNAILPVSQEAKDIRRDVEIESTMMYTLFGRGSHGYSRPPRKDRVFGVEINKRTPNLITKYNIRAPPIKERGHMDDILHGWEDMKNGKVSGQKLVYRIPLD